VIKKFLAISFLLFSLTATAAHDLYPFTQPEQRQRFTALTSEVRCLVCQNQSIADSNAPLARDLREQVYRLIDAGKSNAQVKKFLLSRYGDYVLFKPRVSSLTWLLWLLPLILLLIGAAILFVVFKPPSEEGQLS